MLDSRLQPPEPDEIEVSIWGPGIGEAIALHVGYGKWILVDSCLDRNKELPQSLRYLQQDLGIDVADAVELVVATHWHDDHIRGLADLLSSCSSAKFVMPNGISDEQFLAIVELYSATGTLIRSGVDEFSRIFEVLKKRNPAKVRIGSPILASANKSLYRLNSSYLNVNVYSLAPSDSLTLRSIMSLEPYISKRKFITSPSPNLGSVVLWVEVGDNRILLGGDLEEDGDPTTGWSAILNDIRVAEGKATVFKVPHHGSKNGHHEGIWSTLLNKNPFALITPYTSSRLPVATDIQRINSLTIHGYLTTYPFSPKTEFRNKVVREFVKATMKEIREVAAGWGHIRLRKKIEDVDGTWRVELYDDAHPICFR